MELPHFISVSPAFRVPLPEPQEKRRGEWTDSGGFWPRPWPSNQVMEWDRWSGLPGLTHLQDGWSCSAMVVDDFGALVEVFGLWGQ